LKCPDAGVHNYAVQFFVASAYRVITIVLMLERKTMQFNLCSTVAFI
jgi:hypothetical protein